MNTVSAARLDSEASLPRPHALPAWVYSHPELMRLEIERVLMPSWQIVCHVNYIPRSGDYETFDLGPESVLVLRDRDGSIRGFHNVCRHRGARLLDGAGSCPATITCPYHGWSYRQDGGLVGVPMRDSFPGLDRAEHSLRPCASTRRCGFVFVCLAGDPPPVADTWGKLAEELAPYRLRGNGAARADFLATSGTSTGKSRWIIISSPTTCPSAIPACTACSRRTMTIKLSVPGVARGVSWMREQLSSRWSEAPVSET